LQSDSGWKQVQQKSRDEERHDGQQEEAEDRYQIDPNASNAQGVTTIDDGDPEYDVSNGAGGENSTSNGRHDFDSRRATRLLRYIAGYELLDGFQ
jgi:hypothetical protein